MLATLVVLAPVFSVLPKAVLGAVIIDAVVFGMIDIAEFRRLFRVTRFDFWVAVAAVIGVLSAGVLAGVVVGVVLSLLWLVYVATRPPMPLLGRSAGRRCSATSPRTPTTRPSRASTSCGSTAASSSRPRRRWRTASARSRRRAAAALVLDLEGVNFIDSQGATKIHELHELAESEGFELRIARLKPSGREVLEKDGLVDEVGADHIHGNVHRAVEAQLAAG